MTVTQVSSLESIEQLDNFEDCPAIDNLIKHIHDGNFDPAVLFHQERWYTKRPILTRGDVVKRQNSRSTKDEVILTTRMERDQIVYITNNGGPFAFHIFTLVRKADEESLALAQKYEDEENDW